MQPHTCKICNKKFTLKQYNSHQYYHRNLRNVRFYCKYSGCNYEFVKYKSFKMHLYRSHVNTKRKTELLYSCNVSQCDFKTRDKPKMNSHMYNHIKSGSLVKCPYSNCKRPGHIFNSVSNLKSHLYRAHLRKHETNSAVDHYLDNDFVNDNADVENPDLLSEVEKHDYDASQPKLEETYINSLASMYLTLKAKNFLADSALQTIIDAMADINDITLQSISNHLRQSGQSEAASIVEQQNLFKRAHDPSVGLLRSPYVRKQYFKTNFKYVAPVDILLERKGNKNIFFCYIPIIETIKSLMSNGHIYDQWSKNFDCNSKSDVFADIADGECVRNNEFFRQNPNAIQIILYQDAFEVCNPLGSSRKIHKILGIYMTLGNILPHNRSKVDQIQLVALCLESHVKKYGFKKIFEKVIRDIHILETTGIKLNDHILKATIVAVTGDNLGSHQIGGFLENFSTTSSFCRYCYATKLQFNKKTAKVFPLRTVESYEDDVSVALITGVPANGVKLNSILNECKHFHVCKPGLPPCVAHDIYEGVLQYDFMLCLNELVSKKNISYDLLNEQLQKIRLQHEAKYDKVPLIKKGNKLLGSATENLRLIFLLPFAVYDIIEENHYWEMLIILREIICYLMAVKLSIGQIAYLKTLINDYIELRGELFPDVNLRPKHHYLMHYPYLIRMFGPLKHLWTLRFESKHRYFKNILRHSPNYKNVLRTLSERHQLLQALLATEDSTRFTDKVAADEVIPFASDDYASTISVYISTFCIFSGPKFVATKLVFRGIIYSKGLHVCVEKLDDGDFILCRIKYIIVNSDYSDLFFVGNKVKVFYNKSKGVFEVNENSGDFELVGSHYKDLLTHEPLMHFVATAGTNLFSFKSAPFELL